MRAAMDRQANACCFGLFCPLQHSIAQTLQYTKLDLQDTHTQDTHTQDTSTHKTLASLLTLALVNIFSLFTSFYL